MISIKATDLCKEYPLYKSDFDRLKGFLFPKYTPPKFVALKNINFEVPKGEILGIIGTNGSGKSTLSNIISSITYPTSGEIFTKGEVNILSANSGMEYHLTGIENIYFKCTLLGFDTHQIDEIKQDIIDFADIGVHIEQPVRTYSSGMRSRLGFAISINIHPDILIIDEGLAVGDGSFYDKCIDKMQEIKNSGKTIIYITHSVAGMEKFCDKILWLHKGEIIGHCDPLDVILPYCGFAREYAALSNAQRATFKPSLKEYQEKYL